jgi:hypothetical protein
MRVHQETVDSYLEDIIASSIDHTSILQAKQQVRQYATIINGLVDELEKRYATFMCTTNETKSITSLETPKPRIKQLQT